MMVKRSNNNFDWLNVKNILEILGALITAIVFLAGIGYGKSKCDFLVLSGDKWREKNFLLSDKSA